MYRRSLLKKFALGSTFAAPMTAILARSAMAADTNPRIKTLFIFHPNGANPLEFFPKPGVFTEGTKNLPAMSAPLERVKKHLLFLEGVGYVGSRNTHEGGSLKCLTGVAHQNQPGRHGLTSIEVQMGKEDWLNRQQTQIALPSIQMGCGTQWGDNFDKRISFDKGKDLHAVDDPRMSYPQIFGNGGSGGGSGSSQLKLLSAIKDDLKRLQTKLGTVEREKLEMHAASIAVLEAKLNPMMPTGDAGNICSKAPDLSVFGTANVGSLWSKDVLGKVSDVQQDIAIRALACGVTRTIAFSYGVSVSPMVVPGTSSGDHDLSHVKYASNPEAHRSSKVWWMEEVARFIEKMAATPDGADGSSLLDNTIICAVSDLGDGNKHSHFNIPMFLAGGKNTGLVTNRALNIGEFGTTQVKGDGHPDNTAPAVHHSDILMTIADIAGYTDIDMPTAVGDIHKIWTGGVRP